VEASCPRLGWSFRAPGETKYTQKKGEGQASALSLAVEPPASILLLGSHDQIAAQRV
jgi:hypothetical protein